MPHQVVYAVAPGKLSLETVETPTPRASQVLVKVHYGLFSAVDGHQVIDGFFSQYPHTLGLSATGEIVQVGADVGPSLAVGDKVLVYTPVVADRGIQEYITAEKHTVGKLPPNITPEEGASVPDNIIAAWWTVHHCLSLPLPKSIKPGSNVVDDPVTSEPVLVWGAGTSAGQGIVQVLKLAGYKTIIATASKRSAPLVLGLGATHVIDYNDPEAVEKIKQAAGGKPIKSAVEVAGFLSGLERLGEAIAEGARVAYFAPIKLTGGNSLAGDNHTYALEIPADRNPFKKPVDLVQVMAPEYVSDAQLKDNLIPNIVPAALEAGLLKPSTVRVFASGDLAERVYDAVKAFSSNGLGGGRAVIKIS